jgi:DNA mismatch endonuclease (patch repair protein)
MDLYLPSTRSALMAKIGGKNTKPELIVHRAAHAMGYRFRLHRKDLPGRLDLVFPKYHVALFVHGCFGHRHYRCKKCTTPATRTAFWEAKFNANLKRDKRVQRDLEALR